MRSDDGRKTVHQRRMILEHLVDVVAMEQVYLIGQVKSIETACMVTYSGHEFANLEPPF